MHTAQIPTLSPGVALSVSSCLPWSCRLPAGSLMMHFQYACLCARRSERRLRSVFGRHWQLPWLLPTPSSVEGCSSTGWPSASFLQAETLIRKRGRGCGSRWVFPGEVSQGSPRSPCMCQVEIRPARGGKPPGIYRSGL